MILIIIFLLLRYWESFVLRGFYRYLLIEVVYGWVLGFEEKKIRLSNDKY